MMGPSVEEHLEHVFSGAPVHDIRGSDRFVVVSDMHMGDGSSNDDFLRTSSLFKGVFQNYYFERGFDLILNGDIEDLHKFMFERVVRKWRHIYELFMRFREELSLFRLHGNHDPWFYFSRGDSVFGRQFEALRMRFQEADLFFLHGHQASNWIERMHNLNRIMFKTVINPLRIPSLSLDLGKKGITAKESRLSGFSLRNNVVTFMGHTHRPLFGTDSGTPLLYNSGAAIGKRGITTLEIDRGQLNLVHWFDRSVVRMYLDTDIHEPERLGRKDIYRVVLNSRPLREIFRTWEIPHKALVGHG
ncbi:MAG: metallophosphoesterase family protein [Candidatus Thermoplasmatota archaeon]|nr:metallophosphoesterase family protein [Candidatus Thermoplasmatota archaeon]